MGNNSSSDKSHLANNLEAEALRRFNIRVNSYSYPHHGPYYQYIEWCRGQFELDCIPECCRQGPNNGY